MGMLKSRFVWLGLVVAIGVLFRLWQLGSVPPSLYWEEVALGYDAYSILKTGKDYHGNNWPLVAFPSFGDFKPSLYFYATVPSVALLGLNEMAVRLPSALAGIWTIVLVYGISRQLKLSGRVSVLAVLLLSISPWHIQFSRAAFEVTLATTLLVQGIWCLLKARGNGLWLYPAAFSFGLSMYTYHGLRVIAPLIVVFMAFGIKKQLEIKHTLVSALLGLVLVSPILLSLGTPAVNQRLSETSIFPLSPAVEITNKLRAQAGNTVVSRLVHHRYFWWGREILSNYFSHFNLEFLFLSGDTNPRHGTGEFGLLYHWELVTLAFALYLALKAKRKFLWLLIGWILIVPLPSAITTGSPHALRFLPAAPAFAILSAYGLVELMSITKKPYRIFGVVLVAGSIVAEALLFNHFYFNHYSLQSQKDWQYGYKQLIEYTESVKNDYSKIYITRAYGRPSIYALFYGKYDPASIQLQDTTVAKDQQELLAFDTYVFSVPDSPQPDSLVVTSPVEQYPGTVIQTISFLDGSPAFIIYTSGEE